MKDKKLQKIADKYGTPLYVSDTKIARQRYKALDKEFNNIKVKYATKSNFEPSLVAELYKLDAEFVCGSSDEAMIIYNNTPIEPNSLQVTAVSPKDDSIHKLLKLGEIDNEFTVTANDLQTIDRLLSKGYDGNVLIRLKPDERLRTKSKYSPGSHMKFGMTETEVFNAVNRFDDSNATLKGFHCHLGGSFLGDDTDRYIEHIKYTLEKSFDYLSAEKIDEINFGGGFGISQRPEDVSIKIHKLSEKINDILDNKNINYVIEPGRYISGTSSVLLTKAVTTRHSDSGWFVGVDAGMSEFLRPMAFNSYHPIRVINKGMNNDLVEQTIAGPTCSGADVFCHQRKIPKIETDDIIAIENVGAYGFVMSNIFHGYSLPRIYNIRQESIVKINELIN